MVIGNYQFSAKASCGSYATFTCYTLTADCWQLIAIYPTSSPSNLPTWRSISSRDSILSTLPSDMWKMRSETSNILWSCVAVMMVTPFSLLSRRSSAMISSPVLVSKFPVGSSASTIAGSFARERAIATRCCRPPESSTACVARDHPIQRG